MSETVTRLDRGAQVWRKMLDEALVAAKQEPCLASFLHATVLNHDSFGAALSYRLAQKLGDSEMNELMLREVCDDAICDDPTIADAALVDAEAVRDRDPACLEYVQPFLYFKGYQAVQAHRVAHWLWKRGRRALALHFQSRVSEEFGVDIHPAAEMGRGVMMDHATGIVIGETAVVGDDVSLLHGVTLGGTGKHTEDRHPKVRRGVLIGAGAKVLGNIEIGEEARVASGSVVLQAVPPRCTVAGVPAKPVGKCAEPARTMEQRFDDYGDVSLRRP